MPSFETALCTLLSYCLQATSSNGRIQPLLASYMLHSSNNIASYLRPIDARVQLLVHEPTNSDILSSYKVKSVRNFGARLWIFVRPYDALHCLAQDDIRQLIAR